MTLPKGVHKVVARGREYFYFQDGRNTDHQGPRISLPKDSHSPDFWTALRKAQGADLTAIKTVGSVCDLYLVWLATADLADGTKEAYRLSIRPVRKAWESLPAEGLKPQHVQALMDEMAIMPGAANNTLAVIKALSAWGRKRGHFPHSLAEGIAPFKSQGGHKPWTAAQMQAAEQHFTGAIRRAYFLARYTGQRGSDVIRLGETFIDDGGFKLRQKKNGKTQGDIWCPIEPALEAEMASWNREPGPYLRQENGKPYNKRLLELHFKSAREAVHELVDVTLHGLRGTRVIELRQRGDNDLQIQDQVGMSLAMIGHYCRFADKKANGKAAVIAFKERRKNV